MMCLYCKCIEQGSHMKRQLICMDLAIHIQILATCEFYGFIIVDF